MFKFLQDIPIGNINPYHEEYVVPYYTSSIIRDAITFLFLPPKSLG